MPSSTAFRKPRTGARPCGCSANRCAICEGTFSPSLPFIEDGHRYPSEVKRLGRVVNTFTDASLEDLQDICTVHFGVRPSDQQLHNWTTDDTREIVENDLPQYSGIYTYDEQHLRINGERAYRFTLYDDLMDAPVGERIADRLTKDTVCDFLTDLLDDKPAYVITTDGRDEYAEIVEDDVDAFHHRCHFHFLRNGEKKLRNEVFRSVRHSDAEKLHAAIVWSEFKSVFATPSYAAALRWFEAVLNKVEHLPSSVRMYVAEVMENFDKFLLHLRDEWVPSTTNNCERYFGHTKPTLDPRRFRSVEGARSYLKTQMTVPDGQARADLQMRHRSRWRASSFPPSIWKRSRTYSRKRSNTICGVVISKLGERDPDALAAPFGAAALGCVEYCCSITNESKKCD